MSSCPKRYAADSIKGLSRYCSSSSSSSSSLSSFSSSASTSAPAPAASAPHLELHRPLLFLYPKWFRLGPPRHYCHQHHHHHHHYHTLSTSQPGQPNCANKATCRSKCRRAVANGSPSLIHRGLSTVPLHKPTPTRVDQADSEPSPAQPSPIKSPPRSKVRKVHAVSPREKDFTPKVEEQSPYHRQINIARVLDLLKVLQLASKDLRTNTTTSTITVPTQTIDCLTGTSYPNTWLHQDGSGCVVHVSPTHGTTESIVELQGSERAREITKQFLLDAASRTPSQPILHWSQAIAKNLASCQDIRSLPSPPTWTHATFLQYVRSLTRLQSNQSASRYLYQRDSTHNKIVADLLVRTFGVPSSAAFISTQALQEALIFCRQNAELASTAEQLWNLSLAQGLPPDVSCFNQELGRCLNLKNGTRFTWLVHDMRGRGIKPNGTTWALAIRYAQLPATRTKIMGFLKKAGLLELKVNTARIAEALIRKDAVFYVHRPDGINQLVEQMNTYFGPDWLTASSFRHLLRACRMRKVTKLSASELLAVARKATNPGIGLTVASQHELIRFAAKTGSLGDALDLVRSWTSQRSLHLDQKTIHLLFLLAWKSQYYNVCRILWFKAATSGQITFEMRRRVRASLKKSLFTIPDRKSDQWSPLAGRLVIGSDLDSENFPFLFPHLAAKESSCSPVQWLMLSTETDEMRHEQLQLGHLLMERDLNAWRFYEPIPAKLFRRLMEEAHMLDKDWHSCHKITSSTPEDLLNEVHHIRLIQRPTPIKASRNDEASNERRKHFIVNGHKLNYDTLRLEVKEEESEALSKQNQAILMEEVSISQHPDGCKFLEQNIPLDEHIHVQEDALALSGTHQFSRASATTGRIEALPG